MQNFWNAISSFVTSRPKLLLLAVVIAVIVILLLIPFSVRQKIAITPYSDSVREAGRSVFSISSQKDYIYKAKAKGRDAAVEFLKANPSINSAPPLFPKDFEKNASVTREELDRDDPFLKKNNAGMNNEHYFFTQSVNGIPVYNSSVVVHLRNGNEIYAVSGDISTSSTQTMEKLNETNAAEIARRQAQKESGTTELKISVVGKYYINEKLLGISENSDDQLAVKVDVESLGKPVIFRTSYLVGLTDGKILYSESQTRDALSRTVNNCSGGTSCPVARQEGGPVGADTEVNNLYDDFQIVYDYYHNSFGRDSYDGSGAPYVGYVHAPTGFTIHGARLSCPNAFWNGSEMVFCSGLVVLDVTGHELTHALTQMTAGLQYVNQSGALNESISDMFGSEMDKNWDLGEEVPRSSGLPVPLRSLSNPPAQGNPDKLSSALYYCGSSDSGGVHKNSGVMNKTYYLMVDGGNFNGCSINGIGRQKGSAIVYQALTKYLTQTSNFKATYNAFLQACGDLYGASSSECDNVNRAMQATEIDQQPAGSSQSPTCSGGSIQPATCASGGAAPTVAPTTPPTGSSPTPTGSAGGSNPTPTPVVGSSGSWKIVVSPICEGKNPQLKIDYDITDPFGGDFETLNAAGNPTGLEDMSYVQGGSGSPAKGKGTYISKGNMVTPNALKQNYEYTLELHTVEPSVTNSLILTLKVKTNDCSVTSPTSAPTSSVPTPTPTSGFQRVGTPTPTPDQIFSCVPDPKCVKSGKSIQLCPLVCSPQLGGGPGSGGGGSGNVSTPTPVNSPNPTTSSKSPTPTSISTLTPTKTQLDTASVIANVSESRIREYLVNLVEDDSTTVPNENQSRWSSYDGQSGRPSGNKTEAAYVKSHFDALGLSTSYQSFPITYSGGVSVPTNNVIGKINGMNPNDVYLVTSHLDSRGDSSGTGNTHAPGADDNGSGTVLVMEVAKVLKESGIIPKSSIEFITFSGEEQGLYGSRYYVNTLPSGKNVKGVINLDMIGNRGSNDCAEFLFLNGGLGSALSSKIVEANSTYNIGLAVTSQAARESDPGAVITRSDQWPFLARNIPATFGMECEFSPVYHSPDDKINLINFTQITKITKAVAATVLNLAQE